MAPGNISVLPVASRAEPESLAEYRDRGGALWRRDDDLTQFAYRTAHDLQEPLRMVASYTRLVAERYQGKLDPQADAFLAYAVEGAERMQALIDHLLAVACGDSGRQERWPVDSGEALDAALANLRLEIEESRATIIRPSPMPVVRAAAVELAEMFQNLISNAIRFRIRERPSIHVGCEERKREWLFWVGDNGVGLGGPSSGAGMGLEICRRIAERHGGRLWAGPAGGGGATFYFTVAKG